MVTDTLSVAFVIPVGISTLGPSLGVAPLAHGYVAQNILPLVHEKLQLALAPFEVVVPRDRMERVPELLVQFDDHPQAGFEAGAALGARESLEQATGEVGVLRLGLEPEQGARWLRNYLSTMVLEVQTLARACGKSHVLNLEPEDLTALTIEAAAMAKVPLAGTDWIPGNK